MFSRKTYYQSRSQLLEQLLEQAGEAREQPPPPEGGIPKQWLPHWVRWSIKALALPFVLIDVCMQKIARTIIRPPFKRVGSCKRRGNCCHYVLIQHSTNLIGRLFYFWYTQVHGFYLRTKDPHYYENKRMHVMGCRYLRKDGSCGQYALRPLICRQWPVVEHFGYPKMLKGCGYRSDPPYPPTSNENKLDDTSSPLNILQ